MELSMHISHKEYIGVSDQQVLIAKLYNLSSSDVLSSLLPILAKQERFVFLLLILYQIS